MSPKKNTAAESLILADQVNSDEIDLLELFGRIWAGRILVASLVGVVAIVAFVGLKLAPSYYKIETTIDAIPKEQLRPIFPSSLGSADYQVSVPDEQKVYNKVLLQVASLGTLRVFWEAHTGKPLPEDLKAGGDEVEDFKKFVDGFQLEPLNPKSQMGSARKISLEEKSRASGVKLMNDYLDFLAQEAWKEQAGQLAASYTASLQILTVNYNNKVLIEERRLNDSLISLHESLKIAKSMGIVETPFKQLENIQLKVVDSRDYLMGTKSLSAQIDILTARQGKSLAPYSAELRGMDNMRDQMNSDLHRLKELEGKLKLFSVVNPPEASLDPVRPKKALIFIGLVFLAGLIGVVIVLIRSYAQERKSRETADA